MPPNHQPLVQCTTPTPQFFGLCADNSMSSTDLQKDCASACALVQKLTSTKQEIDENVPKGTEHMPRSELHFASGIAYTMTHKAGLGLSYESGHGFVISKLPGDAATGTSWTWSAPLFINVHAGGVGITVGYSEIESLIVLDSPEAVGQFAHSTMELDTDITGAAGSAAATHLPATAANFTNMKLTDKTFTYSITKGAMLDVSLVGLRFSVDVARNKEAYGSEFVTPQAILDGGIKAPAEFLPLYETLNQVLKEFYEVEVAHRRVTAEGVGAPITEAAAAAERLNAE